MSARGHVAGSSPGPPGAEGVIVPAEQESWGCGATFSFDDSVEGRVGLSDDKKTKFQADFFLELAGVENWAAKQGWLPMLLPDLRIFVGGQFRISKSLVPAWFGHRGLMEFPTWRVLAGKAAITHELVHVYFPNANRLLAEGLAVYVQDKIGRNAAFPNFGRPLHGLVREQLRDMVPEFRPGEPRSLKCVHLVELERIATPGPLTLKIGPDFYDEGPQGQARLYPIAGSFVQFLIETRGTEKFHTLYARTPLVAMACDAGAPGRWMDVYGISFADLEWEWKAMIMGGR